MRTIKRSSCALLLTAMVITLLSPSSLSQSTEDKRPKLKDFGSSIKRLKWDPETKKAVDTKPSEQAATSSDEEDVVRIETNLVTCEILVVDGQGNLVENLTAKDFIISEDGQPQQTAHFRRGDDASVGRSIVLIIDYSRSQLPFLRRSVDAAKLMVEKLAPLDLMAIVTDDVELLVDFTNDKSKLKGALDSLVERTKGWNVTYVSGPSRTSQSAARLGSDFGPGGRRQGRLGKSDQYSALMATLKEAFRQEDLRPIIVLQTDGDEVYYLRDSEIRISPPPDLPQDLKASATKAAQNYTQRLIDQRREFGLADIYDAAERSRATIYTVVPGVQLINRTPEQQLRQMEKLVEQVDTELVAPLSPELRARVMESDKLHRRFSTTNLMAEARSKAVVQGALAGLSERAGGWTEFLETPDQAKRIYERILSDINRRYIIGYYPTNKDRNGGRRKIRFEIAGHPEYYILGRNSYYAPASN